MSKANPRQDRRKYDLARHHAWGGLGLLSVFLALRYLFPSFPDKILFPIILFLILYIIVSLSMTYRYRASLRMEPAGISAATGGEKSQLKLEKKRAKAALKARKKAGT